MLVASASNDPVEDQGAPAVELQPGDAPNLGAGRGLVVTAAEFDDTRAGTGFGSQISLAAYGFFDDGTLGPAGPDLDLPAQRHAARGRPRSSAASAAARSPTATTTPTCRARRWPRRRWRAWPRSISDLNPFLTLRDKLTLIKQTARRPGGWSPELGWGIIDAGARRGGRAADRPARAGLEGPRAQARCGCRRGRRRLRVRVRWSGSDPGGAPNLVPSGVRDYDLYAKRGRGRYRRVRRATRRRSAVLQAAAAASTASTPAPATGRATARRRPGAPTCAWWSGGRGRGGLRRRP